MVKFKAFRIKRESISNIIPVSGEKDVSATLAKDIRKSLKGSGYSLYSVMAYDKTISPFIVHSLNSNTADLFFEIDFSFDKIITRITARLIINYVFLDLIYETINTNIDIDDLELIDLLKDLGFNEYSSNKEYVSLSLDRANYYVFDNFTHILFDADDTILDFTRSEDHSFYKMCEELNILYTDELYEDYVKINKECWQQVELGKMSKKECCLLRFSMLSKKHNIECNSEIMEDSYRKYLNNSCYKMEGIDYLLDRLDTHNYIISNGLYKTQIKRLTKAKLIDKFENLYISEKIGYDKPSKEFSRIVLNDFKDVKRSKILVIGDSLTSDIAFARLNDLYSIQIVRGKDAKAKYKPDIKVYSIYELYLLSEKLWNMK